MAYYDELGQLYGDQSLDLDELEKQAMLLRANQRQQADELNQRADSSNMLAKTISGIGAGLEAAFQGTGGAAQKSAQAIQNVDQMDIRRRQQALLNEQAGLKSLQPIIDLRKQKQAFENKKEIIPLEAEQRLRAQLEVLALTGDQKAEAQLKALDTQMAMQRERLQNQKEIEELRQQGLDKRFSQKESRVSAAKAEKPPSQNEFKDAGFARRIEQSEQVFKNLYSKGYQPQDVGSFYSRYAPEFMQNEQTKQQLQAERNFVNSVLRNESGAAISPSEFESAARQYFPRPGDTQGVLKQKELNRKQIYNTFKASAGRAFEKVPSAVSSSSLNPDQRQKIIELLKSKVK